MVSGARVPQGNPPLRARRATGVTEAAAVREACGGAPGSSVVRVAFMTKQRWESLGPTSYSLTPGSTVWVVTVHADAVTEGSLFALPTKRYGYTVTIDASTGQYVAYCIGCLTLG